MAMEVALELAAMGFFEKERTSPQVDTSKRDPAATFASEQPRQTDVGICRFGQLWRGSRRGAWFGWFFFGLGRRLAA